MVSIIIPAKNEEETITTTLSRLTENLKDLDYEIIVVNDYSTDQTEKVAKEFSQNHPQVKVISNIFHKGLGGAFKTGFRESKGEFIVPVMADLCDDPKTIIKMYELGKRGFDVICGSRYIPGGGRIGGPRWKAILSRLAGNIYHFLTGIPTKDTTNAFKMYRKGALEKLEIESKGFEISVELSLKLYFKGYKFTEIPTWWRGREKGKSKFSFSKLFFPYLKWLLWGIKERLFKQQ